MTLFKWTELCRALDTWQALVSASESVGHSVVSDSVTPWTVALQAPLSVGFSRQEY